MIFRIDTHAQVPCSKDRGRHMYNYTDISMYSRGKFSDICIPLYFKLVIELKCQYGSEVDSIRSIIISKGIVRSCVELLWDG